MSPTRIAGIGEGGDIFTPTSDETVARLGEVAALRAITDTLGRMGTAMQGMIDEQKAVAAKLGEMHTDIAVMKLQKTDIDSLKTKSMEHDARIKAIELIHASEDGARKGFKAAREWAPTFITLIIAIFALLKTGAIHL